MLFFISLFCICILEEEPQRVRKYAFETIVGMGFSPSVRFIIMSAGASPCPTGDIACFYSENSVMYYLIFIYFVGA